MSVSILASNKSNACASAKSVPDLKNGDRPSLGPALGLAGLVTGAGHLAGSRATAL